MFYMVDFVLDINLHLTKFQNFHWNFIYYPLIKILSFTTNLIKILNNTYSPPPMYKDSLLPFTKNWFSPVQGYTSKSGWQINRKDSPVP